jgi:RNA polymerase sigma factor (TIGR02999 family)
MEDWISAGVPVTELLRLSERGDTAAEDLLFRAIFGHLRRLAASKLKNENRRTSLEPTELVNEAYYHLFGTGKRCFNNRAHFMSVAARAMHCVLVDVARKRNAGKRNWGTHQVTLNEFLPVAAETWPERMLQFEEVLRGLAEFDARAAQIVELRVFVGLKDEEIAEVVGISSRTVKRDYKAAKAWLEAELRVSSVRPRTKTSGV